MGPSRKPVGNIHRIREFELEKVSIIYYISVMFMWNKFKNLFENVKTLKITLKDYDAPSNFVPLYTQLRYSAAFIAHLLFE